MHGINPRNQVLPLEQIKETDEDENQSVTPYNFNPEKDSMVYYEGGMGESFKNSPSKGQ